MFRVALKSLLGHKLRMLLTFFAIAIGVSFVAGTYIFTDSMSSTFDSVFEDAYTSVDLTVRPIEPEFGESSQSLSPSTLELVSKVEGVDEAEAEIVGVAQLLTTEGELIGGTGPPTFGFSWTSNPDLNALRIEEGNGRPPVTS